MTRSLDMDDLSSLAQDAIKHRDDVIHQRNKEIEGLRAELDRLKAERDERHGLVRDLTTALENRNRQVEELTRALILTLPMAKSYANIYPVGSNAEYIIVAEAVLR